MLSLVSHFSRPKPEPNHAVEIPPLDGGPAEHNRGLLRTPGLEEKRSYTPISAPSQSQIDSATSLGNARRLPVPAPVSAPSNTRESPSTVISDERLSMINRLLDRGVSGDEITRVIRMFDEGRQDGPSRSGDTSAVPPPPEYDFTSKQIG